MKTLLKLTTLSLSLQLIIGPTLAMANTEGQVDQYKQVGAGGEKGLATVIKGALMTGTATVAPAMFTCSTNTKNNYVEVEQEENGVSTTKAVKKNELELIEKSLGKVLEIGSKTNKGTVTQVQMTNTMQTFSHYIFAGGAAVLLASEIQGAILHKKFLEAQEKEMESMNAYATSTATLKGSVKNADGKTVVDKEQKDTQLTALRLALANEVHAKDLYKKRLNWLKAVEVVYYAAVIGAASETLFYALTRVPAYGSSIGYWNWGLGCNSTKLSRATASGLIALYKVVPSAVKGEWKEAGMGAAGAGISYLLTGDGQGLISRYVDKAINISVSSAPARIVGFGLFGALSSVVRSDYSKKVDATQKNISLLQNQITDWQNTTQDSVTLDMGGAGDDASNENGPSRGSFNSDGSLKALATGSKYNYVPCIRPNSSNLTAEPGKCSGSMKFDQVKFDMQNSYINGIAKDALKMATAAASGDMASAEMMASGLAAQAARVKSEADRVIAKAQEELKKQGEPEIDFKKEIEKGLAAIQQDAQAAMAKEMQNMGLNPEAAKLAETKEEKESLEIKKADTAEAAAPAPSLAIDFGLDSNESSDYMEQASSAKEQSFDEFESTVEDISKKHDVSIFKQLSNRYILNYTKIFETRERKEIRE